MDDTTFFEQRPTHSKRPTELRAARKATDALWQMRDDAIEAHLAGFIDDLYAEHMEELTREAKSAEATYAKLYQAWQATL